MTRRRWLAVVVVVIACGGAAFAATQSATDVYTGLSEQRLPFSLSVAPDGETLSLDVAWRANCGGVVHTERRGVTRIADDGQFTWAGTHVVNDLTDGDEQRQRMRLVGRREGDGTLTGVWRGDTDHYNGQARAVHVTCSSGDVAFRVTRDGSTDQPPAHRDAAGHLVIGLATEPDLVAVGAGKAWVLGREIPQGDTTLTAIDQRTGVAGAPKPLREIDAPDGFAAGEGAAWVATGYGAPTALLRIDPPTRRVVRGPPIANSGVRLSRVLPPEPVASGRCSMTVSYASIRETRAWWGRSRSHLIAARERTGDALPIAVRGGSRLIARTSGSCRVRFCAAGIVPRRAPTLSSARARSTR